MDLGFFINGLWRVLGFFSLINVFVSLQKLLKRPEYFSKFGKIHKIVVNSSTNYAGPQVRP